MRNRQSLIHGTLNMSAVRWFDMEFAPFVESLGFYRKTVTTILELTSPEITRYRAYPGKEPDLNKLRQLGRAATSAEELMFAACMKGNF